MEFLLPTIQVMKDMQVTPSEVSWYGNELVGIAIVALATYMLNRILEAAWS